jgi:predicted branched-subunit amino acid permease
MQWWEAMGFSTIVFGGSAQFAAVSVLAAGGSTVAAITAGSLLTLRSLAFGVLLAPALGGPRWRRALESQLVIDESTAIALTAAHPSLRRFGFLAGGVSVFVLWNLGTLVGAIVVGSAGDLVTRWGLDATIPAAFLALLWPRLADRSSRRAIAVGLVVAIVLVPFAPAGLPIVAAGVGVMAAGRK